ncbi:MAG: serine--tRNA ligase [Hellea sp.]|nr:serine--tRNA ligase [Hellea sp.]|tara:strand:- start:773 stop:2053 length:1281 start_codon:yes stop_codon:yes gene_type:complete
MKMHDIKSIRENPKNYDELWSKRGLEPIAQKILNQDALIRKAMQVLQEAEAARNKSSKLIGRAVANGDHDELNRLKSEVSGAKNIISAMGIQVESEKNQLQSLLSELPNIPFPDVPIGDNEDSNVELHRYLEPPVFDFSPKGHDQLGEELGMMDFETAAKMSGSRFVVLQGSLSRLDRALSAFMLDIHTTEFEYTEYSPPVLVREHALFGTGQLPKFEEDLYKTTVDQYLIPTAEVSLTNIVRESIIDVNTLPRRMTAQTPCFRSEAGSAGKDTRGMIRQHQFNKVELVSVVKPGESLKEHKRMLRCAEEILKRLNLPYRVVELCTGDLGFSARRTFDIEVWLPSQNTYREISSCSDCGDFQARRMNARYKHAEKDNRFVHTLNGSGLAVGRTLVAILENYQNSDGSIRIPEALIPYMGGIEVISH